MSCVAIIPVEVQFGMAIVVHQDAVIADAVCAPAPVRVGLLGLGNVGSAVARLSRDAAPALAARGFAPIIEAALVRSARPGRPASDAVLDLTEHPDVFFSHQLDVVIEVLGGVEPARTLVRRALDRGIPVVTANKSLVAAHGHELAAFARRRGTAFRYEASVIAGVPFLGTFERRPLVSRTDSLIGILNGTSNFILTQIARGSSFADALGEAQRRGYAEPDPSMDVSGGDAAEKLAVLIRQFGGLIVPPRRIPRTGIDVVEPQDLDAARECGGVVRPVASAAWSDARVRAFVAPAFVPHDHPLAPVAGSTNAVLLSGPSGTQCYSGPGAGPDVTAATLLDDVAEVVTEGRVRPPSPIAATAAVTCDPPATSWFVRVSDARAEAAAIADLLAAYGVLCSRVVTTAGRIYLRTFPIEPARLHEGLAAVRAATRADVVPFHALEVRC